ncbi:MAG: RNA polymerase sigma factor, partial [Pirellulales bacterium]
GQVLPGRQNRLESLTQEAGGRMDSSLPPGAPNSFDPADVPLMDLHDSRSGGRHDGPSPGQGGGSVAGVLPEGHTDEELLRRCRVNGDSAAFESLVQRDENELFSYLRRYLGNAEMADDVFQATFLQVHLKREQFEEGRRFRPWLYTIATNQAIDAQRRNRRHRMVSLDHRTGGEGDVGSLVEMLAGSGQTADAEMEAEEARDWVRSAVNDLPESLKGALMLVYHQGMKYREAADVLGIPVGTVKSRLHSALLKLNESWRQSGRSLPGDGSDGNE